MDQAKESEKKATDKLALCESDKVKFGDKLAQAVKEKEELNTKFSASQVESETLKAELKSDFEWRWGPTSQDPRTSYTPWFHKNPHSPNHTEKPNCGQKIKRIPSPNKSSSARSTKNPSPSPACTSRTRPVRVPRLPPLVRPPLVRPVRGSESAHQFS